MNAQVDETLLIRPFFVQYRLELLRGVAAALGRGELQREQLANGGLENLLNGLVRDDWENHAGMVSVLKNAMFEAVSKVKFFKGDMSKLYADFAAECIELAPRHWPEDEVALTMCAALGCRLAGFAITFFENKGGHTWR